MGSPWQLHNVRGTRVFLCSSGGKGWSPFMSCWAVLAQKAIVLVFCQTGTRWRPCGNRIMPVARCVIGKNGVSGWPQQRMALVDILEAGFLLLLVPVVGRKIKGH